MCGGLFELCWDLSGSLKGFFKRFLKGLQGPLKGFIMPFKGLCNAVFRETQGPLNGLIALFHRMAQDQEGSGRLHTDVVRFVGWLRKLRKDQEEF